MTFDLVVHRTCNAETDTCLQPYNPCHFDRNGNRADANIHKTFANRNLSNNLCTVVEEWTHGHPFLDTLRPRDTVGSESVTAVCSGFWARSLLSCQKLHWSPFEHWPFSFHWQQVPYHPPSTTIGPFRLLTTAPDSILPCLASKIRYRSFCPILLFTMVSTFDCWAVVSSDESPCRTMPTRF